MDFVNNIPQDLRPQIDVYQNYDPSTDMYAVYNVLFGSARYGFDVNLLAYTDGESQLPALNMAQDMFVAMGAGRHEDRQIPVSTLNMNDEGTNITTNRQMVVVTGPGDPTMNFTEGYDQYMLTNLWGGSKNFSMILPGDGSFIAGSGVQEIGALQYLPDGCVLFRGTIGAGQTGYVLKKTTISSIEDANVMSVSSASKGMQLISITDGQGPLFNVIALADAPTVIMADLPFDGPGKCSNRRAGGDKNHRIRSIETFRCETIELGSDSGTM